MRWRLKGESEPRQKSLKHGQLPCKKECAVMASAVRCSESKEIRHCLQQQERLSYDARTAMT